MYSVAAEQSEIAPQMELQCPLVVIVRAQKAVCSSEMQKDTPFFFWCFIIMQEKQLLKMDITHCGTSIFLMNLRKTPEWLYNAESKK